MTAIVDSIGFSIRYAEIFWRNYLLKGKSANESLAAAEKRVATSKEIGVTASKKEESHPQSPGNRQIACFNPTLIERNICIYEKIYGMKGSDSSTNIKTVLNDLNDGRNVSVLHIKNYVGKENPQQPKKEHKTVDLAYSPKKTENPYIDPRAFKPHGTCEFERRKNKEEENKLQKASLGIAFGRVKKPPKVVLPVTSVSEIGKEVARVIGGDYTARGVAKAINAMHGYEQLPDEYKELAIEYFAESFRAFFSVKRYVDLEADAKGAICQRLFGYAIYLAKQSSDLDDKYAKHEDRDPLSTVSDPRKRSGKKKSALLDRRPQEIGIAYRNYLGVKDKVIKITDQKGLTQIDINERDIILSSFEKELPSLLDCEGLMVDAAANILQESLVDIILDKNLRQNLLNAFQINYIERVRSLIHC